MSHTMTLPGRVQVKMRVSSGQATVEVDISVAAQKLCVPVSACTDVLLYITYLQQEKTRCIIIYNLPATRENSWRLTIIPACTCIAGASWYNKFIDH